MRIVDLKVALIQLRAHFLLVLALIIGAWSMVTPAWSVQPDEVLEDKALEQRARSLSAELRCLVCQNQSIDDSDAPLARDLRLLVRERLKAGDTDDEIMSFVVDRYGEFVLLKPPFGAHTLFLWLSPIFVLLGAIWLARSTILGRNKGLASATPAGGTGEALKLSVAEEERLQALLADDDQAAGGGRQGNTL